VSVHLSLRGVDLQLAAEAWGPLQGQCVLFLHGGGQTRHSWGSTSAALADEGFRVIALDLRGHGDSDWSSSGDYDVRTIAADVCEVVAQVGPPVVLVGASLGGLAGLHAAARLGPEGVSALVLVDVVPRVRMEGVRRIVDFMTAHPRGFATVEDAAAAVAAYLPHRTRPSTTDGLQRSLRQIDGRWHWHWDPQVVLNRDLSNLTDAFGEQEEAAAGCPFPWFSSGECSLMSSMMRASSDSETEFLSSRSSISRVPRTLRRRTTTTPSRRSLPAC
jgi:pimeloyl-ACP methyl ester carboxylesterase